MYTDCYYTYLEIRTTLRYGDNAANIYIRAIDHAPIHVCRYYKMYADIIEKSAV